MANESTPDDHCSRPVFLFSMRFPIESTVACWSMGPWDGFWTEHDLNRTKKNCFFFFKPIVKTKKNQIMKSSRRFFDWHEHNYIKCLRMNGIRIRRDYRDVKKFNDYQKKTRIMAATKRISEPMIYVYYNPSTNSMIHRVRDPSEQVPRNGSNLPKDFFFSGGTGDWSDISGKSRTTAASVERRESTTNNNDYLGPRIPVVCRRTTRIWVAREYGLKNVGSRSVELYTND